MKILTAVVFAFVDLLIFTVPAGAQGDRGLEDPHQDAGEKERQVTPAPAGVPRDFFYLFSITSP